ncbi:MAG TPA: CopD family protein [Casimicrobiaceae bacterium]
MRIALWLHLLATVLWVGGMFFAHVALRPAVQQLPAPQRLTLLAATMGTFFRWVGGAVAVILASGFMMIFASGGFAAFGGYVHVMSALGIVMTTIYGYIVAVPYSVLRGAVEAQQWERAGTAVGVVRRLVGLNLILGLATITVAVLGRA